MPAAPSSLTLGDALFTVTQQKVLSLLYGKPDRSYFANEIARWAQVGKGSLMRELDRLHRAGVLSLVRQGNQTHYQANPACPIYQELLGIVRKTFGLAAVLGAALHALDPLPRLALVFGSLARGDENARSDVDLLVIGSASFAKVVKALHPAQELLQRDVNPIVYNAAEFARRIAGKDAFVANIIANPKLFVIGTEHDLGKLAGNPTASGV